MDYRNYLKQISPKGWIFILTGVAFGARLLVTLIFADNHSLYYEYMEIARNILDGKGYSWDDGGKMPLQATSFLPPVYIFWCLIFMWLSPQNFLPMYIAQAFVAASGVIPAYLIGDRLFSKKVGWIFSAVYAVYPELVFLHSRPVSEFLYVVLALWILYGYCLLREGDPKSPIFLRRSVLIGLLCGFAMLIKEGAAVLMLAISLALLVIKRPRSAVSSRAFLPIIAAACFIVLPWTIRNYIVQERFIPIRTGFGYTAWVGNHPGAQGMLWHRNGKKAIDDLSREYEEYLYRTIPKDEQNRDAFYMSEVKRFIIENPGEYLKLCVRRLVIYFWFDPTHPFAQNVIYRISYIITLVLAIPGIFLAIRGRKLDPIVPLIVFGYMFLYVPVLVLPRYRIIPMLMLLMMASYFITFVYQKWANRHDLFTAQVR